MVRMVENEARSLGETPERVIAWKEILDILNRRELTKEKLCDAASQTNKVEMVAEGKSPCADTSESWERLDFQLRFLALFKC